MFFFKQRLKFRDEEPQDEGDIIYNFEILKINVKNSWLF